MARNYFSFYKRIAIIQLDKLGTYNLRPGLNETPDLPYSWTSTAPEMNRYGNNVLKPQICLPSPWPILKNMFTSRISLSKQHPPGDMLL